MIRYIIKQFSFHCKIECFSSLNFDQPNLKKIKEIKNCFLIFAMTLLLYELMSFITIVILSLSFIKYMSKKPLVLFIYKLVHIGKKKQIKSFDVQTVQKN